VCFIAELLEHGRVDVCNVGCPTQKHFGDGKDAIPKYLKAIATDKKGLRGVLVVVDADDDPNGNFEAMADALEDATFTRPRKPFTLEESNGIRVGVFLMPKENQNGTLEDLLLEAVFKTSPKARDCVGKFADCVGHVNAWTPNHQAKMKLSSLIAAYCEDNPWCSLSYVWSNKGNPIPINSDCFTPLADFLKSFCG
jgi:hypothetical protein